MDGPSSLLNAPADRLAPFVGIALFGHLVAFAAIVAGELLLPEAPRAPLIDPRAAIEVYAAMPKSSGLPQRATRAAMPAASDATPSEAVVPPKQSEMAFPTDKPDPKAAGTDDPNRKRAADAKMRSLLDDLDADVGPTDRDASSPEGTVGGRGTRGSGKGDPELARYIEGLSRLFMDHFTPLPNLKGQGLKTTVLVRVDEEGRLTERRISAKSGNAYWDRAALAATEGVQHIPLPPEKYRALAEEGLDIVFEDP